MTMPAPMVAGRAKVLDTFDGRDRIGMPSPRSGRRQRVAEALDRLAPGVPRFERGAILDHAETSSGLRHASPEESAWLSMVAFIRHQLTDYDDLLADDYDLESARYAVAGQMRSVLQAWGVRRPLASAD